MNLLKCLLVNNRTYTNPTIIQPKGIMWHSTGANNPNLKRYVQPVVGQNNYNNLINILGKNNYNNHWNNSKTKVSVHAFIGKAANGEIMTVQTLPWDYKCWGCGGTGNDGWIQFEICEFNLNDKNYFDKVYKEAIELTAYLCKLYNLNPLGTVNNIPVILCHSEGCDYGIASNHADVLHWFKYHGKTMNDVRNDVADLLDEEDEEEVTQEQFNQMMDVYLAELAEKEGSAWSAGPRDWAKQKGLINGGANGDMWQKFLTREEFVAVLQRALSLIGIK